MHRGVDYQFLEPMIMNILEESPMPLQALTINFKINEESGRIIDLNTIKNHLDKLVEKRKVLKKVKKTTKTTHYEINRRSR